MAYFEWNSQLDIHVESMNAEHKVLIGHMNNVYEKNKSKAPKNEIKLALQKFAEYTVQHFKDEEAYMESIGFPKIRTHKMIHEKLLTRVGEFIAEFDKGDGTLPQDFFVFLKNWLVAHIQGIDMQYGEFK